MIEGERYAAEMRRMWLHPSNNQRPSVIRWLQSLGRRFEGVVDIGCGDAYYIPHLDCSSYTVVEPNPVLLRDARARVHERGIVIREFGTIQELLCSDAIRSADLVLAIHVLLYLATEEADVLLRTLRGRPLVVVHPWPRRSVTTCFGRVVGDDRVRRILVSKRRILGRPSERILARTHFRLPLETSLESLGYLVSQGSVSNLSDTEVKSRAVSFVQRNLAQWKREDCYELPQWQVLEKYCL